MKIRLGMMLLTPLLLTSMEWKERATCRRRERAAVRA